MNKATESPKAQNETKDEDVVVVSDVEMDVKSNSDKESETKEVELSSSDDNNEEDKKDESEIEFSRTETSEMDASLIFEQGSLMGSNSNLASLGKKKVRIINISLIK